MDEEVLVKRLTARRNCSGCGTIYNILTSPPKREMICDRCGSGLTIRDDDNETTVRNRLTVYKEHTAPVLGYYEKKGNVRHISADADVDMVFEKVREGLR